MGRTLKSSKKVFQTVEKFLSDPEGAKMIKTPDGATIHFTHQQKVSAVLELFCKGRKVHEIMSEMEQRYGPAGKISRETTYDFISHAAQLGRLKYEPPAHLEYESKLQQLFPWLHAQVVNTTVVSDVVRRTADTLLIIVQEIAKSRGPEAVVHIGLAGGLTMRKLASRFADLLCRTPQNMPAQIKFYPLVSGFDPYDPTTDPNSFVSYYWNKPAIQVKTEFRGFRAPSIVTTELYEQLRGTPGVEEAFDEVENVDIVVTSGSDCPEHGAWNEYADEEAMWEDEEIGDMLWRPLGVNGPIENNTKYRAMTLIELNQLPDFVERNKYVILMTGPCGGCLRPKNRLLRIVLEQKQQLVTHVVADSRSVARYLQYKAKP